MSSNFADSPISTNKPPVAETTVGTNTHQWIYKGIVLSLFALGYLYIFLRVQWRVGDEGMIVYGAELVTEGALPFRDFFRTMGPLNFYWLALFFKIFGTKWIVARVVLLLTGSFTAILIYWMTRRLYRGPFNWLPAVFCIVIGIPIWPGTSHHWDSNFFALLAIAAYFLRQDYDKTRFLIITGLFAGLTSCFMQHKGLYLFLSIFLVELINEYHKENTKRKILTQLGYLSTGYIGVGVVVVIFYYSYGGLSDLIYANLIFPLSQYININAVPYGYLLFEGYFPGWLLVLRSSFPDIAAQALSTIFLLPFLLVLSLPVLAFIGVVASFFNKSKRSKVINSHTLPYLCSGIALWLSEIHRMDMGHLIFGSPMLLIFLFLIWRVYLVDKKAYWEWATGFLALCLILFGTYNGFIAINAKNQQYTRRGVVNNFTEDSALKFLNEEINQGEDVFIYPYYPMYYFLADIKNPTRYSTLMYNIHTEKQFKNAIADLNRKKVKYVLWDTFVADDNLKKWWPKYGHPQGEKLYLERYLETHYKVVDIKNGFRILLRKES